MVGKIYKPLFIFLCQLKIQIKYYFLGIDHFVIIVIQCAFSMINLKREESCF